MQPAADAIAAELADEARMQRLKGVHEGWARALALLLAASAQLPSDESHPQRLPADWQPVLAEALAEALRCFNVPMAMSRQPVVVCGSSSWPCTVVTSKLSWTGPSSVL